MNASRYHDPLIDKMLNNLEHHNYLNRNKTLRSNDLNFCNQGMVIAGVLKDQVDTYTSSRKEMNQKLTTAGREMIGEGFGWNANISVEAKLARELEQYQRFQIFINTIIDTVVAFLAILSI